MPDITRIRWLNQISILKLLILKLIYIYITAFAHQFIK